MEKAIDETSRRRIIQIEYNKEHGITPTTILKSKEAIMGQTTVADAKPMSKGYYVEPTEYNIAADPVTAYLGKKDLINLAEGAKRKMENASFDMDFLNAAKYRDEMKHLEAKIKEIELAS